MSWCPSQILLKGTERPCPTGCECWQLPAPECPSQEDGPGLKEAASTLGGHLPPREAAQSQRLTVGLKGLQVGQLCGALYASELPWGPG